MNAKPLILADKYIPYLKDLLEDYAEMQYLDPKEFTPETVKNADALIIRTRCKCNAALLSGSKVKFIATATIGCDHIDDEFCRQNGIQWKNAPGCNSNSVANYVYSALSYAFSCGIKAQTIGVVGVGNVGSKVVNAAKKLGLEVLQNDPPRQIAEQSNDFCSLDEIREHADIITFHVPLKADTRHICDADFLAGCKRAKLIINSARGGVCDDEALLHSKADVIIDCWENEPNINLKLLKKSLIGTPHIAGYSADGKANGTAAAAKAVCEFFGFDKEIAVTPPPSDKTYNALDDSLALKAAPEKFEWMRNNYPLRRDMFDFSKNQTCPYVAGNC